MKKIIHVESTPEPSAYHEASTTNQAYFAFHASFEIIKNGVGNETEVVAQKEYETFLDSLEERQVLLLKVKSDLSGVEALMPCTISPVNQTEKIPNLNLVKWLEDRKRALSVFQEKVSGTESSIEFYVVDRSEDLNPDAIIQAHQTSAGDLLRSSLNWTAPIPQRLGLTSLVSVENQAWDDIHVLVLYPKNDGILPDLKDFTITELTSDGKRLGFDVSYVYPSLGDVVCRTPFLTNFSDQKPDPAVFKENGQITFNPAADALFRLVNAIEEGAASRFWTFVPLTEFEFNIAELGTGPTPVTALTDFDKEISWLVRNSFLTLFDPFFLAMKQPVEAPLFWSRLVALVSANVALAISQLEGVKNTPDAEDMKPIIQEIWEDYLIDYPITPETAWELFFSRSDAEFRERVPNLKKLLGDRDVVDIAEWQIYVSELADLAVMIEDEVGLESIILDFLKKVLGDNGEKLSLKLDPSGKYSGAVVTGLQAFQTFMNNEWNASESLRRDVGRIFSQAVINRSQSTAIDNINQALIYPNWFSNRVFHDDNVQDAFTALRASLPEIQLPTTALNNEFKQELEEKLTQNYKYAVAVITNDQNIGEPFRPDPAPQPLPIQIASKLSNEIIDKVSGLINGFGIIIQTSAVAKIDDDGEGFAHASLVGLVSSSQGDVAEYSKASILPALPTINDGSTELFINYRGLPLHSNNQIDSSQGGPILDDIQRAERDAAIPPFLATDADLTGVDALIAPPPLAYGFAYSARAFWVGNSGALPLFVRADADAFTPKNPEGISSIKVPYLRRTAVSEITIRENTSKVRMGVVPKGVFPLATDYPRLSLSSSGGKHSGTLDLFRRSDGSGRIWIKDNVPITEITLHDYRASENVEVKVRAYNALGSIEAEIETCVKCNTLLIDLKNVQKEQCWLRVSLTQKGIVSFADPSDEDKEAQRADNSALVLIAPKVGNDWISDFSDDVGGTITAPGVSFPDLDCWISNPKLMKRLSGFDDVVITQTYIDRLREAKSQFGFFDELYADRTNRLPDPAIECFLITLETCDSMDPDDTAEAYEDIVRINPYQIEAAILENDKYQDLTNLVDKIFEQAQIPFNISCGKFDLQIEDQASSIKISVPTGMVASLKIEPLVSQDFFAGDELALAKELKDYLVRHQYEGDDEKIWHVLPGTNLKIEGMSILQAEYDPENVNGPLWLHEDSQSALVPTIEGTARGYQLKLKADKDEKTNWRQFGEADVITQRWRSSGRPIYRWIDPLDFQPKNKELPHVSPVIEIKAIENKGRTSQSKIDDFENDAFFDRLQDDAERSRVRLVPSPAPTPLGKFEWPAPSASYFRHRLALRSRYATVMKNARREVSSSKDDAWTSRAAILADMSRVNITRPQVRSFLPILRHVNEQNSNGAPAPLICILAEKPFDQFGLADRIVAEIETVHNYRIEGEGEDKKLRIDELRKEFGPDPRLSYFGVDNTLSKEITLRTEGPVGLHFDSTTTANPAFSNSQYLLHIDTPISREDLEESFSGVSLQRIPALGWIWTGAAAADQVHRDVMLDPNLNTCWLEITSDLFNPITSTAEDQPGVIPSEPAIGQAAVVKLRVGGVETVHLNRNDEGKLTVKITNEALYPSSGVLLSVLSKVDLKKAKYSLLHRRLDDSRYSLSVLERPLFAATPEQANDYVEEGIIDQQQLVASIEYFAAGEIDFLSSDGQIFEPKLRQIVASNNTFVEWVRTNRNLSEFYANSERVSVSNLSAKLIKMTDGKPLLQIFKVTDINEEPQRLRSPIALRNYPLHVHRHLAVIIRQFSTDLGREIGLYNQSVLLGASGSELNINLTAEDVDYSVAIAEFETRAEVLLNKNSLTSGANKFTEAKFDLISTRPQQGNTETRTDAADEIHLLRFNVRVPYGEFGKGRVNYTLSLEKSRGEQSTDVDSLEMAFEVSDKGINQLVIVLRVLENDKVEWHIHFESNQGSQQTVAQIGDLLGLKNAKAIKLKMERIGRKEDFWTDISLLHSSKSNSERTHPDTLDFDWLFNEVMPEDNIATAVSQPRLNTLAEAQARLIGLSEPVIVHNKLSG